MLIFDPEQNEENCGIENIHRKFRMKLSKSNEDSWKKSRSWMFMNYCLGAFLFGLSLTAYYPTEYYYFKDTMKVKEPDLFYGLSWAFLCGSGVITSLLGSYYADSTKNVREVCLVTNVVNIVGNILYVLYYSPYLVLFGQLLVGTAAARMVAAVGEISRVYETSDLTQNLSFLGIFSTIGSVTGPCTTYLFALVDTDVGAWKLNIGNMVGITMAILYFLQLVLNYFTLENVSKQYNLKEHESETILLENMENEKEEEEEEVGESDKKGEEQESFYKKYVKAIKVLLQSNHILFLYSLCFFASFARATITLLQPIKAVKYLSWKQTHLATFNIISTVSGAIPTAVILTLISKRVNDFYLLLFTLLTLLLALGVFGFLPWLASNQVLAYVVIYSNGILTLASTAGFHIISRSMLAKFVPDNIQTVTEAIRNALFELSYMVAGLSVKLPSSYFPEAMICMAVLIFFAIMWLLYDHKKYKQVKIISLN